MKSTDLARLVEREKDLSARLDELTEGSKSKDECLAKWHLLGKAWQSRLDAYLECV